VIGTNTWDLRGFEESQQPTANSQQPTANSQQLWIQLLVATPDLGRVLWDG
jgi:hypothetical protein